MTRSPISGPKRPPTAALPDRDGAGASGATNARPEDSRRSSKIKEKGKLDKAKAPKPKMHSAPKAAAGAHAAAHDAEEGGAQGVGGVEGREGAEHAQRHQGPEVEAPEHEEEIPEHEGQETAATGADAVKRAKGDAGGGDGFEGERDQREAYERWMRGRVGDDQERIAKLKAKGARDDFNAERTPREVEALGTHRAVAHVVRLHEGWALAGLSRDEVIGRAAQFLAGFSVSQNIRKVLLDLESSPIRDVYPLEVLMRMLDERPELLPGVRAGKIVENADALADGAQVFAGHPIRVQLPADVRIKSFALLGGGRPGYEFHPREDDGVFNLLVDTPGRWTFALLAAPLQQLGRIKRETSEAMLEILPVHVGAMGRKGEPLSAEAWAAQEALDGDEWADEWAGGEEDEGPDESDAGDVASDSATGEPRLAPSLAMQVRGALDQVRRDEESAGATTYSWRAELFRPGGSLAEEPLLRLVIERAGPFDPAWVKARNAVIEKQREWEPARAVVTAEDFTEALRRARYR